MAKINIDIEQMLKDAFKEAFDAGEFINDLSHDISNNDPEWWASRVIEPLRDTLNKAISENKDFLKEIIWEFMDREFYDKVDRLIKVAIDERVEELTRGLRIRVENDDAG